MSSTKLLDTVNQINGDLGAVESKLATVQWQLKSFYNQLDEDSLLAIPVDFNPDHARKELDTLLRQRLDLKVRLQDAEDAHQKAQSAELATLRSELTRRYKTAVKTMIESAVSLTKAVQSAENLRDEARFTFGGAVGFLPHIGPHLGMFENRFDSPVGHWVRESIAAKCLTGSEPFLKDVAF